MSRRAYRADDLTPVEKVMRPTYRHVGRPDGPTRNECWEAYSVGADGKRDNLFAYHRMDGFGGTPWEIAHAETGMAYPWPMNTPYQTLDEARHDTHARPVEILAGILDEAHNVAANKTYLPQWRDKARAAIPVLEARIAALATSPVAV